MAGQRRDRHDARTNDRQYWTQSRPSGANGNFASFLVAADQEGDDPVPMQIGVAVNSTAYTEPAVDSIPFAKLKSATLNVQLPAAGTTLVKTTLNPQATAGAIYQGLLVGVVGGKGRVIRPVSATWPGADGRFTLVLPSTAAGQTVQFWEADRQFFSTSPAKPTGSLVDLTVYPKSLSASAPQGLAVLSLPH